MELSTIVEEQSDISALQGVKVGGHSEVAEGRGSESTSGCTDVKKVRQIWRGNVGP